MKGILLIGLLAALVAARVPGAGPASIAATSQEQDDSESDSGATLAQPSTMV
jgi:hypothetical protein